MNKYKFKYLITVFFNIIAFSIVFSTEYPDKLNQETGIIESIFVKNIAFKGNTVLSKKDVNSILSNLKNRQVSFEELQKARRLLTEKYIENGYINSGVIIPDQPVREGKIEFHAIEGKLTGISIEAGKNFKSSYFRRRIKKAGTNPLNIYKIQRMLQRIEQNQAIKNIQTKILPETKPGTAIISLKAIEETVFRTGLRYSNDRSPSIGGDRWEAIFFHRNLLGYSDSFKLKAGIAEGLDDIDLNYNTPINSKETTLNLNYSKSDGDVVEQPFKAIGIKSLTETVGFSLRHPTFWSPNEEFGLSLGITRKTNNTSLLGQPFSFSDGAEKGRSVVSTIDFSQDYIKRSKRQVLAGRSSLIFGVDAFGSTINNIGIDSRFFIWNGQFQWIRRINENGTQAIWKNYAQLSNDRLLPVQKFSVGGSQTVRGYRENYLIRDNAIVSSLEYRIPVHKNNKTGKVNLFLAPFIDYGNAWDKDSTKEKPRHIASGGLGLRWNIGKANYLNVYYGIPFTSIPLKGDDLQDDGIHFDLKICLTEVFGFLK